MPSRAQAWRPAGRRLRPCAVAAASEPPSPAQRHYAALLSPGRPRPSLWLAPMEGLGDVAFRRAFVAVGGCVDEACSEFIRLPGVLPPTPRLLAKQAAVLCDAAYRPEELRPWGVPLAAQLMGSEPTFLACATQRLAGHLGAEHVQLNAGCPANTVCGRGAGASLLADTAALRACVEAMARAAAPHGAVLSVKLRLGAGDASQLGANLAACADGGAAFVVLHGRTGAQGYGGRADYGAVGLGVAALAPRGLPVVGNGDVAGPGDAAELLRASGCRGVMAGRGAAADPLLFRRLRAYFAAGAEEEAAASRLPQPQEEPAVVEAFLRTLYAELLASAARRGDSAKAPRFVLSRLKQQCVYLFGQGTQPLLHASALGPLLRSHPGAPPGDALEAACEAIRALWRAPPRPPPLVHRDEGWLLPEAAAPRPALVNAFSRRSADAARTAGAVALAAAAG